jgi:hypothetical protein
MGGHAHRVFSYREVVEAQRSLIGHDAVERKSQAESARSSVESSSRPPAQPDRDVRPCRFSEPIIKDGDCKVPLNQLPIIGDKPSIDRFTLALFEVCTMNNLIPSLCHLGKRRK